MIRNILDNVTAPDSIDVPKWVCEHPKRGAVTSLEPQFIVGDPPCRVSLATTASGGALHLR